MDTAFVLQTPGRWLEHHGDRNASAGIGRVTQVIATVDVIDIDVIRVVPARWPRLNKSKPIATVLEARISADQPWAADAEFMLAPKVGTETIVRDPTSAPGTESQCRLGSLSPLLIRSSLSVLLSLLTLLLSSLLLFVLVQLLSVLLLLLFVLVLLLGVLLLLLFVLVLLLGVLLLLLFVLVLLLGCCCCCCLFWFCCWACCCCSGFADVFCCCFSGLAC